MSDLLSPGAVREVRGWRMISLIELEATLLPFLPGTSWASHSMVSAVQMNDPGPIYCWGSWNGRRNPIAQITCYYYHAKGT